MSTPLSIDPFFSGKRVIVTGAGSGIGRATALRFARQGAEVVATDISPPRLEALLNEQGVGKMRTLAGDIATEATVRQVAAACEGRVDILANVAGIMDAFLPAAEVDDATWERVFAVNLTAVMRLTRAVLPLMMKAGKGAIVNIASEAGLRGACAGAAYTASKYAVIGYTKNTAFMYAPHGIRVNAIAPGAVLTNIEAPFKSELAQQRLGPVMGAIVPKAATADQLAEHICWLSSDAASNITGIVMPSDGGWSAI